MRTEQIAPRQMSDSTFLGALLTLIGGFLDAYSYLMRGGVFANAQTGNIVLLGVNLAQGNFVRVGYYLVPVLAFCVGILVSEWVRRRYSQHRLLHWRQITVGTEVLILLWVSFLPAGEWDTLANVLISLICAIQVQSFRKLNGSPYASTMCTGNLRSGAELLFRFSVERDRERLKEALRYLAILCWFVVGAMLGVIAVKLWAERATLLGCLMLGVCIVVMCIKEEK